METSFIIISFLTVSMSFLPSLKITHWVARIFDYVRIQVLFLAAFLLLASFFLFKEKDAWMYVTQFALVAAIANQLYIILPYFPKGFIPNYTEKSVRDNLTGNISMITANVLQKNDQYHKLIKLVKEVQPDILLTTETNKAWENALTSIQGDFAFNYKIALENRYGMHFYTKLKAVDVKEHFLMSDQIPSIEAHLMDENGNRFVFWGVHPPPPSPTEKPTSRQKDAELAKLAKLIRDTKHPSIVAGDFNDVCWSRSTKLFAKISALKDVRVGRGILGTFPIRPRFLRFPIDLVFSSQEIKVGKLDTLTDIGSDHLPLFSNFSITLSEHSTENEMEASLKKETEEVIAKGRKAVQEEENT